MEMKSISGVIEADEGAVIFANEGSLIHFYSDKTYCPIGPCKSIKKIPLEGDGFLRGKSHGGNTVAFYVGEKSEYTVPFRRELDTGLYIVSSGNVTPDPLNCFSGIKFTGGVLNILHNPQGFVLERGDDMEEEKLTRVEADMELDMDYKNVKSIFIYSESQEINSVKTGARIYDKGVSLELILKESQPLSEYIYYYNLVVDLCKFLSFREKVGFDRISLMEWRDDIGGYVDFADCYMRDVCGFETDKSLYNALCFDECGEAIPSLLELMDYQYNKDACQLGFLPETDRDLYRFDNNLIRRICSAMECEIEKVKQKDVERDPDLQALIQKVKGTVKEFRKDENHSLTEKTYGMIFGSMEHWTFSLSDRIYGVYQIYEDTMRPYLQKHNIRISKEDFESFVKYRNNITHGRSGVMDQKGAMAAMVVRVMICCCILQRAGLSMEEIGKLVAAEKIGE